MLENIAKDIQTTLALLKSIVLESHALVHQEFDLTQSEVKQQLKKVRAAALSLSIGIGLSLLSMTLFTLMVFQLLESYAPQFPQWISLGIVALAAGSIAALLLTHQKRPAPKPHPSSRQLLNTPSREQSGENSIEEREPLQIKTTEEIRQRIEVTRASLSEKLNLFGSEVKESVDDAKTSVSESIDKVKHIFDIEYQVQAHPWPYFGASVLLGLALSKFVSPKADSHPLDNSISTASAGESKQSRKRLVGRFEDELRQVKGIALGVLLSTLRELATDAATRAISRSKTGEAVNNGASKAIHEYQQTNSQGHPIQ